MKPIKNILLSTPTFTFCSFIFHYNGGWHLRGVHFAVLVILCSNYLPMKTNVARAFHRFFFFLIWKNIYVLPCIEIHFSHTAVLFYLICGKNNQYATAYISVSIFMCSKSILLEHCWNTRKLIIKMDRPYNWKD